MKIKIILLQLNHLPKDLLHERLPGIAETSKIFANVDITKDPVPVILQFYYNMGWIYKLERSSD